GNVDDVGVRGIGEDAHVVEGALAQTPVGVDAMPAPAAVIGTEDAAILRLHDGIDDLRIARGHRYADAAEDLLRESGVVGDLRPVRPTVGALVESASPT